MLPTFESGPRLRRILLATDFAAPAQAALAHAARLARIFESSLHVAHIIELPAWKIAPELTLQWRIEATRKLDQVLLCPELRGLDTQACVRHGGVAAELLGLAQQHAADLVVTGISSRRGLNRLLASSAVEHLAESAPCPVMTVGVNAPMPGAEAPFRNIVLATSLNPGAGAGISYARSFARSQGAKLWIAHSMRPRETGLEIDSAERWLKKLAPDQPGIERVAEVGSVEEVTIQLARRECADLVMLAPGLGSRLPLLARQVACPVMAVRYAIPMIRPKSFGAVPAIGS